MTSTQPDALRAVLWAALEDYVGLWEVVWELNSLEASEGSSPTKLARSVTRELDARGWVEFYQCLEPDGEMIPLDEPISRLLDDDDSWAEPESGAVSIRMSATDQGKRAYEAL